MRLRILAVAAVLALGTAVGASAASQLTGAGFAPVAAPGPSVGPQGAITPYPAADVLEESVGGTLEVPAAAIGGTATWYCGGGSPCTRGHGPGELIAAIDPGLGIRRGERITVHSGSRSVSVVVVDVCACAGSRIVDLSRLAFSRLADPSRGTIPVSISVGGPLATEIPLPQTDTEPVK